MLTGLDLEVPAGSVMAVLGASGSGKSTLLRIVAGLERPDDGQVAIDGRDVTSRPPGERRVGLVFQRQALLPHLTVAGNIGFGLRGVERRNSRDRVESAAEFAGCRHLLDRTPGGLSGGERQRVALARALVRRPAVVLLDEPLSSLDAHERADLRTQLRVALAGSGTTAIHVTHDQSEAFGIGDRIAVLAEGAVQQVGTADDLLDRPENSVVAGFVGTPRLTLVPADEWHLVAGQDPGNPAATMIGVRATAVRVTAVGAGTADGHVSGVEVADDRAVVQVEVNGIALRAVTERPLRPTVGSAVGVEIDAADLLMFGADRRRLT